MKIDPNRTWRLIDQRLSTETDPVLRRNLEMVRKHAVAEATCNLDALMATVSDKAHYHAFGAPDPRYSPNGKPAVRKFYADYIASGAHRLEHDITRLVVDRHAVLTEGVLRIAYPGALLGAMGIKVDDPNAYYLYESSSAIIWMFDEHGLVSAEDSYTDGQGFNGIAARKLRLEDIGVPKAA